MSVNFSSVSAHGARVERTGATRWYRYIAQRLHAWQPLLLIISLQAPLVLADETNHALSDLHDTVIAHADEAWESDDGTVIFIQGQLELRGSRWRINADSARIEGGLGHTERVVVDGKPARLVVTRSGEQVPVEGRSEHLEFEPNTKLVRLEGEASIVRGAESISSDSIRYLFERDIFSAGAHSRVKVTSAPHPKQKNEALRSKPGGAQRR
jgi:lipopolysaccharide transport protein LptA